MGIGSSPHTRGARGRVVPGRPVGRIIPAYAGSTCWTGSPRPCSADHPRIRGEHPVLCGVSGRAVGSSPHTRGAPETVTAMAYPLRIIPAYAGSTACSPQAGCSPRDHPRIRGEHCPTFPISDLNLGSSPHTRGAQALE